MGEVAKMAKPIGHSTEPIIRKTINRIISISRTYITAAESEKLKKHLKKRKSGSMTGDCDIDGSLSYNLSWEEPADSSSN